MNAQEVIDNSDRFETNNRKFRDECNISFLINDVVRQFDESK